MGGMLASPRAAAADATPARLLVIKAGRLFDGTSDEYRKNVLIVIEGERIKAVGAGRRRVAARGRRDDRPVATPRCCPGLIDCHTHLGGRADRYDEILQVQERRPTITPSPPWSTPARRSMPASPRVRDVGSRPFLAVDLRDSINEGFLVGPRVVASGPGISMTGGHGDLNRYAPQVRVSTFP